MLGRLIKYDMKAISRFAVPMIAASWALSFLCCAVLYFTFGFAEELNSMINAFMITGSIYLIGVMAIGVMLFLVTAVVALRYYKSVFGDEGYLNMSIPVSRRAFLNSKIISSAIWSVLAAVTAWICVFVSLVLPILLYDTSLISKALELTKEMFGIGKNDIGLDVAALMFEIVISVLNIAKDVAVIIASITLGSVIFKRLKLFLSLMIYFVITFLEELFTDTFKTLIHVFTYQNPLLILVLNFVFEILIISVVFALMYYTALYLLEKRLNLE